MYHLQMVPQIKVDGISILEVIQVALVGKDKNKYSNTETYAHANIDYTGCLFV